MTGRAPLRLMVVFIAGLAALGGLTSAGAITTPRLKPPAPGPAYLSRADHDRLLDVAAAVKKKQFSAARNEAALVADPIARSLGEWMVFMGEDPLVSITAADAFLDSHPDWPAIGRIQSFVEKRIPDNAPASDVLALFQSRDPLTGEGKIQLARAHYEMGAKEAGDRYLRDAWINHNFRIAEERKILSSYGGRLTKADHAARVDRLLWGRQITNARRVFPRLASADRRMAEARAALLLGASSGPGLYKKLSQDQQLDSGVLHGAVRYYRRSGDEPYAIALAAKSPQTAAALRNPGRWWDERQLLMRWALREGRFADAYTVAAHHSLTPGGDFSEAEFNAGWIALRFLGEPKRAETHFLALASAVGTPISVSRAYYWLGRSAAARNDQDLAKTYYETAAKHYYSYYGQLAAEELGGAALTQKFAAPAQATPEERALFSSRPTVAALRKLSDLNLDYEFMVFAYHADDQLTQPGEFIELAKITNGEGAPHLTVRAGKVAIQKNAFAPDVAYPMVFVPDEAAKFMAPEIVLGLSRQESEFNPRAFSHAGARGMMQLIPTTAQITARKEGLKYSRSALLDDPVYNMTLGSAHLSHLTSRFDGSLIMTFASYNAGQNRVTRWVREYGDPRQAEIDPVDWVELIPFSETRNYVQRVLENVQVYRGRLNNAPIPGRLSADLERGGAQNRAAAAPMPAIINVSAVPQQALPPLPAPTIKRARDYALHMRAEALAAAQPPAADLQVISAEEARPAPRVSRRKNTRRARARATANANPVIAEAETLENAPPSPAEPATQTAATAMAPPAETNAPGAIVNADAAIAEEKAPDAAPAKTVAQVEKQTPAPVAKSEALPATKLLAGATTVTSNSVMVAVADNVAVESTPAKTAPAATEQTTTTKSPATIAPAAENESPSQALAPPIIAALSADMSPGDDAGAANASAAATTTIFPPAYAPPPGERQVIVAGAPATDDEAVEAAGEAKDDVSEECLAYRAFLREIAGDEAEAADLNALMLSELQGGVCS